MSTNFDELPLALSVAAALAHNQLSPVQPPRSLGDVSLRRGDFAAAVQALKRGRFC